MTVYTLMKITSSERVSKNCKEKPSKEELEEVEVEEEEVEETFSIRKISWII